MKKNTLNIAKECKNPETTVNCIETFNEYLERRDWRINANANQGFSLGGLILNASGKMTANYWLYHVYTPDIAAAHVEGDFHIHDFCILMH